MRGRKQLYFNCLAPDGSEGPVIPNLPAGDIKFTVGQGERNVYLVISHYVPEAGFVIHGVFERRSSAEVRGKSVDGSRSPGSTQSDAEIIKLTVDVGAGPRPHIYFDGSVGVRPDRPIGYWRAGQEHERPAVWVPMVEDVAYLDDGVWTHGKDGPVILLDGDSGFWYTHEDPPPTAGEEAPDDRTPA